MAVTRTPVDVGAEFVQALAARDFARLERCLASDVDFHAVVPGSGSWREANTAEATVNQFKKWFGDADSFQLLESSVTPIVDKLRIAYRATAFDEGEWQVVEQTGYAEVGERGIEKLDVACSGWQAVPDDPR